MSASAADRAPATRTAPLLVVATFYCEGKQRRAQPFYEIHLAARQVQTTPRGLTVAHSHTCTCLVLRTRDERLYHDALDAEGTEHRVVATWHRDAVGWWLDTLDVAR